MSIDSHTQREEQIDYLTDNLLSRAALLVRMLVKQVRNREISRTEGEVLSILRDGPRRVTELAELEGVAQPTMTLLIKRLEERGGTGVPYSVSRRHARRPRRALGRANRGPHVGHADAWRVRRCPASANREVTKGCIEIPNTPQAQITPSTLGTRAQLAVRTGCGPIRERSAILAAQGYQPSSDSDGRSKASS
jgi:DNA-binding transcriptional ArsR family regulator